VTLRSMPVVQQFALVALNPVKGLPLFRSIDGASQHPNGAETNLHLLARIPDVHVRRLVVVVVHGNEQAIERRDPWQTSAPVNLHEHLTVRHAAETVVS
jgi:hypothetical protein